MRRLILILLMVSALFSGGLSDLFTGDKVWDDPVLVDVVEGVIVNDSLSDCGMIELIYKQNSKRQLPNNEPLFDELFYKIIYIWDGEKWCKSDRIYVTLEQEILTTYQPIARY